MNQKIYWYSYSEQAMMDLEPSTAELEQICNVHACLPSIAKTIRAASLGLVPVIPVWVYGTLMEGEAKHKLIRDLALPEFKPLRGIQTGIKCYTNKEVPFPAAVCGDGELYMERYLIPVMALPQLDQYEGAPDLYSLEAMPNVEGYFYCWKQGLNSWESIPDVKWTSQSTSK